MLKQRVELPIDHFRLLGVSPSAQAEAVLRAFQLRLDRPPQEGFTHEVLLQRAELLRLSADLLTDESLRKEYEDALLAGALGLDLSTSREVAGLILLWEADASYDAFKLARKALQPPQAPALGSGRESDLTLVAALSCKAAAQLEQDQRHYQQAALILQDGIQLLQRMGKLQDHRQNLEKDLESLLPYRILDLVSRDLGEQASHQEGIQLLDDFVRLRGGLEGKRANELLGGLNQSDFVLFFQQIRKFLTVQEQLDLFIKWQRRGSPESGFLGVITLVAAGFSQRKPERLQQARKYLNSLELPGLDRFPLLGSIDLLLADVQKAESRFEKSSDDQLKNWLNEYPGDSLEAICDYCRDWLSRDVLPGYRDVEVAPVDLEAWFADRDVQSFVENIESKGALGLAKSSFSFLSSLSGEKQDADPLEDDLEADPGLPMPGGVREYEEEDSTNLNDTKPGELLRRIVFSPSLIFSGFDAVHIRQNSLKLLSNIKPIFIISASALGLVLIATYLEIFESKNNNGLVVTKPIQEKTIARTDSDKPDLLEELIVKKVEPLIMNSPGEKDIRGLIETWLAAKSKVLSGGRSENLKVVAREALVKRVKSERMKDLDKNEKQIVNAEINTLKVISQTNKRIEVKVDLTYTDQRLKASGKKVSETYIPSLKVTYVLGREKELWQLVDYISGS